MDSILVYLGEGHPVACVEHGQADQGSIGVGWLAAPLTPEVVVLKQPMREGYFAETGGNNQ